MKRFLLFVMLMIFCTVMSARDLPRSLVVENSLARTMSILNLENNIIVNDAIPLGQVPSTITSYRDKIYVLHSMPAELWIVDPVLMTVTDKIVLPAGSNPYDMALVGWQKMYVTLLVANQVAIVDLITQKVTGMIDVGMAPQGLLVDNNMALIANTGGYPTYKGSSVSLIDTRTDSVTQTIGVPDNPQVICKGPDHNYYIMCTGNYANTYGRVAVLNPFAPPTYADPAVVDTLDIGGFPGDMQVLPDGTLYACAWGDQSGGFLFKADIYSTEVSAGAENPIRVGHGAMRLFYDRLTRDLYVNNFERDTIQRLDAANGSVLQTFNFGDGAHAMTIVEPIFETDPWADAVVQFLPGSNWSQFGYSFLPYNVLGPPDQDRSINEFVASNSPEELLSLGHGGEITLEFTDNVIIDGPGADFIVFENCFFSPWTGSNFMEAGIVSVSQDGETFHTFAYDTSDQKGLAGVTPVKSTLLPVDPETSGGDAFDLAELDLDWVRFVRITDMGDIWLEGPFSGDFDLDAVVAVHSAKDPVSSVDVFHHKAPDLFELMPNYPNPFNPHTTLSFELNQPGLVSLAVYTSNGQWVTDVVHEQMAAGQYRFTWNGCDHLGFPVASGVYLVQLQVEKQRQLRKITLIK